MKRACLQSLARFALVLCAASSFLTSCGEPGAPEEPSTGGASTTSASNTFTSTGQGGSGQGGSGQGGSGQGGSGQGGAATGGGTTSSSGGGGFSLACGDDTCVGSESACCFDNYQVNQPPFVECVSGPPEMDGCSTENGGFETRIECRLPEHCPAGTTCCGSIQSAQLPWYSILRCADDCPWPGERVVCDPANPQCPVVTSQGQQVQTTCQASPILPPGYFVCRPP